jgi:hypothetical protein
MLVHSNELEKPVFVAVSFRENLLYHVLGSFEGNVLLGFILCSLNFVSC